jgi:hypothetical protein
MQVPRRERKSGTVTALWILNPEGPPEEPWPIGRRTVRDRMLFVPERFEAEALFYPWSDAGSTQVWLRFTVEVGEPGRARCVELAIRTKEGINWDVLRVIPVRDLVATACRAVLWGLEASGDTLRWVRPDEFTEEEQPEILKTVRELVGYNPEILNAPVQAKEAR